MAGKVVQNDFTIDIEAETNIVLGMLDETVKERLLKAYIREIVIKKQNEFRTNYASVDRIVTNFTRAVYERLVKKTISM